METAARVSSDKLGLFYGDGGRKFAFDSIIVLIVVEQTLSSKMFENYFVLQQLESINISYS